MKLTKFIIPLLFAVGILVSFLREIQFAELYGVGRELEIFRIGYALPNLLSFSVGSAFVSVAVPHLVENGREDLPRATTNLFVTNIVLVFALFVIGYLASPLLTNITAPGFNQTDSIRSITSMKICWLMFLFTGLTWGIRADLNTSDIYWPGASVTLVKAGIFVLGIYMLGLLDSHRSQELFLEQLCVLSGILIFVIHVLPIVNSKKRRRVFKSKISIVKLDLQASLALAMALVSVTTFQFLNIVPLFLDRAFASYSDVGVIASVEYAYAVIIAAGTVFGSAFTMLVLPRLSRAIHLDNSQGELKKYIYSALQMLAFSIVLGTIIFLHAELLVTKIFAGGAFGPEAVINTSDNLRWMGLGFGAMIANQIIVQFLIVIAYRNYLLWAVCLKILAKIVLLKVSLPIMQNSSYGFTFMLVEYIMLITLLLVLFAASRDENSPIRGQSGLFE